MKAYKIHNDKPGLDTLTLTEQAEPTLQAEQVLVRMHAASLNYRDLLVELGANQQTIKEPKPYPYMST